MNKIYYKIDFLDIKSFDEIHRAIANGLMLTDHYGANLDNLFDCLTDMLSQKSVIKIYGLENLANWNNYDKKIIDTFISAKHALGSRYADNLSVQIINDKGEMEILSNTLDTYCCKVDFSKVNCKSDIHNLLSKALGFTEHNVENFDELWEYLLQSLYTRITKIEIFGIEKVKNYENYYEQLIDMFAKAKHAYNGRFINRFYVTVVNKDGSKVEI